MIEKNLDNFTNHWYSDESTETYAEMASQVDSYITEYFGEAKRIETNITRHHGLWYGHIDAWYDDCLGCRGLQHQYNCPESKICR